MNFCDRLASGLVGISLLVIPFQCGEFFVIEAKALNQSAAPGGQTQTLTLEQLCFDVAGDPDSSAGFGVDEDGDGVRTAYCTCGDPATGKPVYTGELPWDPRVAGEEKAPTWHRVCEFLKDMYDNCKMINPTAKIPQLCAKYLPRSIPVSPITGEPLPTDV